MNPDNYYLKEGYVSLTYTETLDNVSDKTYWGPYRLSNAKMFQYYVYKYAAKIIKQHQLQSVLDVGSGPPMKLNAIIAPLVNDVTLVDQQAVEELALEILPSAKFVATNLESIDLDLGRKFSAIICADVVEHLLDPQPTMDFILKHLEPDGYVFFSTPERDYTRGYDCMTSPKPHHVREWNQAEFRRYVESCGFNIIDEDLYPQRRIRWFKYYLSRLIPKSIWTKRPPYDKEWGGCYMVVGQRRT